MITWSSRNTVHQVIKAWTDVVFNLNRKENCQGKVLLATSKRVNHFQRISSVPHSKNVRSLIRDYSRSRRN